MRFKPSVYIIPLVITVAKELEELYDAFQTYRVYYSLSHYHG